MKYGVEDGRAFTDLSVPYSYKTLMLLSDATFCGKKRWLEVRIVHICYILIDIEAVKLRLRVRINDKRDDLKFDGLF